MLRNHLETSIPRSTLLSRLELTEDEQEHLFALTHKGVHSARVITRARILSKLAKGNLAQDICQALDVSQATVLKIRKRFAEGGLQGALTERPRPGSQPKLDAKQAAMITAIACSKAPDGHDHWTLRLLGSKIVELGFATSYSHEGVRQLLKKRTQTVAKAGVVYRKSRRRVCRLHGGGHRNLRTPVGREKPGGVF
jgi:transposase